MQSSFSQNLEVFIYTTERESKYFVFSPKKFLLEVCFMWIREQIINNKLQVAVQRKSNADLQKGNKQV